MAANNEGSSDVPIIFSHCLAAGAASEENSEAQDIQSGSGRTGFQQGNISASRKRV